MLRCNDLLSLAEQLPSRSTAVSILGPAEFTVGAINCDGALTRSRLPTAVWSHYGSVFGTRNRHRRTRYSGPAIKQPPIYAPKMVEELRPQAKVLPLR